MELVLLALLPLVLAIVFLTTIATTALVTWAYTRTCYDGSERSGKRYWPSFRRACCCIPCLRQCYGWRALNVPPLPPDKGVLIAVHPHGMLAIGAGMTLLGAEGRTRVAVHTWLLSVPVIRDLILWVGCIEVTPETMGCALARGWTVGVIPGGVRELDNTEQRPRGFLDWSWHTWKCPVVPVWLPDERSNCHVWAPACLAPLRQLGMRYLRYPVGTFFWPRFGLPQSRALYGKALDPVAFATADEFADAYWTELARLTEEASLK
jgi:hypothetical protein